MATYYLLALLNLVLILGGVYFHYSLKYVSPGLILLTILFVFYARKAVRDRQDLKRKTVTEKLKNEFVSMVSHELRTPLTSIRGSLGLIEGGLMGEIPEEIMPLIKIANNNYERLVRLINDLLDIEERRR